MISTCRSIYQNAKEDRALRYAALTALSRISDPSVVPHLVDAFDIPDLRARAVEQLRKMCPENRVPAFGLTETSTLADVERVKKAWHEWWKDNGTRFELNRAMMLIE
jgi:HEAT repeat protein